MNRTRNAVTFLVGVLGATSLVIGGALPANAVDPQAATEPSGVSEAQFTDQACLAALPERGDKSSCVYTVGVSLGSPERMSADDIKADSSLSTTQKAELVEASSATNVSSNHWSQFVTGGSYTQTQNGTFYYDGSRVWVTTTTDGYTGSQDCFTNYVVPPWGISNISKSDSGSSNSRILRCSWNVDQAGIFTSSFSMDATLSADGTISGAGGTVG